MTKRIILPISSLISFPWTIDKPNCLVLTGFFVRFKFFFFSWCWQENYPNSTNIDVFLLHDFIISYCRFVSFLEFQNTHDSSQLLSEKDVEKKIWIACLNGTNYGEVLIQLIGFLIPNQWLLINFCRIIKIKLSEHESKQQFNFLFDFGTEYK